VSDYILMLLLNITVDPKRVSPKIVKRQNR